MGAAPFDPLEWVRERGLAAGEAMRLEEPDADLAGAVDVDRRSLLVRVPARMAGVAVESRLREHDLTLGLFPERYEVASVATMAEADDPGAGASGPGFASLVRRREAGGHLLLALRQRPEAQAGRAYLVDDVVTAVDALRRIAQAGVLPELALVADPGAADLLLRVAHDPDGLRRRLRPELALLILIAAGRQGEAAMRVEQAARLLDHRAEDVGQNAARAWAQTRYDLAGHARTLASAGYRLGCSWAWQTWSELAGPGPAADVPGLVGIEVLGAGTHGATVVVRSLS